VYRELAPPHAQARGHRHHPLHAVPPPHDPPPRRSLTGIHRTTLVHGTLKVLSSEMNMAFEHVWLVLGLNRGRGYFVSFFGAL
jgi:hypothetical protein